MAVLAERFPDWVESVELLPGSDTRVRAARTRPRRSGRGFGPPAVLELVAYAAGRDGARAFERVSDAVSASDPSFAAAAADLEPRLVASAAVARALENDDDDRGDRRRQPSSRPSSPACTRRSWSCRRWPARRRPGASTDVRERVSRCRGSSSAGGCSRTCRTSHAAAGAAVEAADRAGARDQDGLTGAADADHRRASRSASRRALDAADEELDVLWWAFAAHGERGRGWSEAPHDPTRFLRAGRELADRHRFNAEIPTARAILRRVLGPRGEEEYVLADASRPQAAASSWTAPPPGPLFPVLTANAACLAAEGSGDWVAAAAAARRRSHDPPARRARSPPRRCASCCWSARCGHEPRSTGIAVSGGRAPGAAAPTERNPAGREAAPGQQSRTR